MVHEVGVIGGDGIGPEVVAEALKVVAATGVQLDTVDYDLGGARYLRDGMPFNIGWWGFTFPLGVYAVATLTLGRQAHLALLDGVGAALVGLLVLMWGVVAIRTVVGAWHGDLFFAPCLLSNVAPIADTYGAEADVA